MVLYMSIVYPAFQLYASITRIFIIFLSIYYPIAIYPYNAIFLYMWLIYIIYSIIRCILPLSATTFQPLNINIPIFLSFPNLRNCILVQNINFMIFYIPATYPNLSALAFNCSIASNIRFFIIFLSICYTAIIYAPKCYIPLHPVVLH